MRNIVTSVFSEPEEFQAAMMTEGMQGFVQTQAGRFHARLTRLALHSICLSDVEERLPRIGFIRVPADKILISLSVSEQDRQVWGGLVLHANELITIGPGRCLHIRTDRPCHWGIIWLSPDAFSRYGYALTGKALPVPVSAFHWDVVPAAIREVHRLHSAAIRAARTHSEPIAGPEAAHGLEQQLIQAVVECLSTGRRSTDTITNHQAQELAAKFEGLINEHPHNDGDITKISRSLGVSDRALRRCCQSQLAMGPGAYLRLGRMHSARRALHGGTPGRVHVADVAASHGFHNPGRFAQAYRHLFGELPSQTLRLGPHQEPPDLARHQRAISARHPC